MDELLNALSNPVVSGSIMAIVGWGVERFAPQWIPFFAIGKKIYAELVDLHEKSDTPNKDIIETAEKEGKKLAVKHLAKLLS